MCNYRDHQMEKVNPGLLEDDNAAVTNNLFNKGWNSLTKKKYQFVYKTLRGSNNDNDVINHQQFYAVCIGFLC